MEWGYKYSGAQSVEADWEITRQWITQRLAANPRLWFGSQEGKKGVNRHVWMVPAASWIWAITTWLRTLIASGT